MRIGGGSCRDGCFVCGLCCVGVGGVRLYANAASKAAIASSSVVMFVVAAAFVWRGVC